ncbi:phage tail protein [Stenotrophomonas sp.]|uniref:phage tail protein n=1 Tax=Stenotrophomonas sp. TaxID=69392 RepID=UPI0028B21EBC|nr:phage tail protein [Stenotrophomonas sp.]
MLPQGGGLSTKAAISGFSYPVKTPLPIDNLQDWELAGKYLNDPSEGLRVKVWAVKGVRNADTGSIDVLVSAPGGVSPTEASRVLFSGADITQLALAFDQNMSPFVAYTQGDSAKIYWYDPLVPGMAVTTLPAGSYDLRCCMDERRAFNVANSDIVLSYIRDGNLCVRYQRDRYANEIVRRAGVGTSARLVSMAMNRGGRIQWRLRNYERTDDPGALHVADPFLADVVEDLYLRSGIQKGVVDVSSLFDSSVEGFKVATEGGADVMVQALQQAYFFDPTECDGMLRAVPRGGDPVAEIGPNDMVARDEGPLTSDRAQEAELLRKINVTMLDSSIDYVTNKQTAERRSSIVKAKAEQSFEIPLTASPDFQATVAMRKLKVAWGELQKYEFELPIAFSALVPADVIVVRDKKGDPHRMRIMEIEEDGGHLIVKASENSPWAYNALAEGVKAEPPISTTPGLVGDTVVAILDIPAQRDQDDELGYYVGAVGTGRGWYGAEVQMSTDAGANIGQRLQVSIPSAIGETLTPLLGEVSAEYASQQSLRVRMPEPLESVSYEQVLRYNNKAALRRPDGKWEVLQYQTVVQTGDDTFELSGLIRGRYATLPEAAPAGAMFVVLDESLVFVQVQQWMTETAVSYRAISYGQDSDEVEWESFTVTEPASQQEWPVHYVRSVRDGANAVTVSWVGRARLGVETAPRQSKYFAGYRLTYSDGFTADTKETTHTRPGTPAGATVSVAAINTITGLGPASEAIPT